MKRWRGSAPVRCDLCRGDLRGVFIDGDTKQGLWAMMCASCHALYGVGLGLGRGQRYELGAGRAWRKTAG